VSNNGAAHDTIVALAELFPACFSVFQGRRKPLKVGIYDDVIAALGGAITDKEARLALAIYCGNHGYLRACAKAGTPRIDLAGNAVGAVDADAAKHARHRLGQQKAQHERRREAQVKAKAEAEAKARNAGRIGLADLRAAAEKRRSTAATAAE
jgi:ProP effector